MANIYTTYDTIPNPYINPYLERSNDIVLSTDTTLTDLGESSNNSNGGYNGISDVENTTNSNVNGNPSTQPVKSDGSMGDIWIRNFIRSENWKPSTQGFAIDGQTGYAEFHNVKVVGEIAALTGSIGGFVIGLDFIRDDANSSGLSSTITTGDDVRFWAGASFTNRTTAPFRITESGTVSATLGNIGGFVIGSETLKDVADSFGLSSSVSVGNDIRLWAGSTYSNRELAPFRVYEDGSVYSLSLTTTHLDIPDATSVNSFHVDTSGNIWSGAIVFDINTNPFAVSNAGFLKSASGLIAGFNIAPTQFSVTDGINTTILSSSSNAFSAGPTGSPNITISQTGILTALGVVISGNITATSGNIGGFTIGLNSLYVGNGISRIELDINNGIFLGHNNFGNAPFRVSLDGTLVATNANITGVISATNITADAGTIGGFTLTSTTMYGGIIKTANNVGAGANGVIMDSDGLRGYDSILGTVFNLPTDGTPPSFSSGVINETVFNVSTNGIIRTSDTVGDGGDNSAGILINSTGLYGIAANQTPATANVRILVDGTAFFNISIRGGQTDYETGTGYFLGLSSGDYKLSIGSATNYLKWDGHYLKLRGSFDVGDGGLINNAVYTVANLPATPTTVGYNSASGFE